MSIKAYQTMRYVGSYTNCFDLAPILSDSGVGQWVLKEGYYFWPKSLDNAHFWGNVHYTKNYIIIDYCLDLNREDIFDLVGDSEHIQDFIEILKAYIDITKKVQKDIFVYEVIEHMAFKYPEIFTFLAIQVEDFPGLKKSENNIKFSNHNTMFLNKRIQICLLKKAKNKIIKNDIVYKIKE